MIGLDTNVLVRYLVQDDVRQAAAASRLLETTLGPENPGFVTLVTLCEIAWVLADCYAADAARVRLVVEGLLGSKQLVVQSSDLVWKALRGWHGTADFSDALIGEICLAEGATHVATFDRGAARLPAFKLLA